MVRFGAALAAVFSVIFLWSVTAFVVFTAMMGDCSVDGVRSWPSIDDVDRTSGCLSEAFRSAVLVLAPMIALIISAVLAWCWRRTDRVLKTHKLEV